MSKAAIVFCLLLALAAPPAAAQDDDVRVEATVSHRQITEEDILQLTVSIVASADLGEIDVRLPPLRDFEKLNEQTSRQMTQFNMNISFVFRYIYNLRPLRKGELTIPAIDVQAGGRAFRTEPIRVTVAAGSTGDDIIVRQQADSTEVHVGQQLMVTTELLFRLQVTNYEVIGQPPVEGFVVVEEPLARAPMDELEYRGMTYYRVLLRRQVLFPLSPGPKELKPIEFRITFRDAGYGLSTKVVSRKTNTIRIDVKPLPNSGKPPGFQGAVGAYTIGWKINSSEGRANEPLTLNIELSGSGDIERAPDVRPRLPEGFEIINARSQHNATLRDGKWGGKKSWEYILIPSRAGEYSIGPLEYWFFDPDSGRFTSTRTDPISLHIEPPLPAEAPPAASTVIAESREWDIRFIKSPSGPLENQAGSFLQNYLFWLFILLPPAANGLIFLATRLARRGRSETPFRRRNRALAAAVRALKRAEKAADKGKPEAGCSELKKAALGYFADKLGIDAASSFSDVRTALVRHELHESPMLDELRSILDTCDATRYSPAGGAGVQVRELCRKTEQLLTELDEQL